MQTAVVVAALLLLLSAFPRLGSATAAAAADTNTNQTTSGGNGTGCAPARCGGLTITYPFSLVGAHPIYCGFPAFQLTCDAAANRTYLSRTFRDRLYRVLHIFYGNSSLVMAVEATFAGDGGCRVPDFNVSASLALLPVDISAANRNLTFVYGCDVPPRLRLQPACDNTTMGAYTSDDDDTEPLGSMNCSSVSVPVRWIERGTEPGRRLNYSELIGEGFLLEWPPRSTAECDECKGRGGECRFPDISFQCICRDGRPCRRSRGKQTLSQLESVTLQCSHRTELFLIEREQHVCPVIVISNLNKMLKEFPFHLKLTKMKQLVVLSLKYFSFEAPKKKKTQ